MSDLRVLGGGAEAFSAILRHIDQARSRIEIHAFLWCDDNTGNKLAEALLEAAGRGVTVVIHKDRVAAVYELSGGNNQSFFHKQSKRGEKFAAWVLERTYLGKDKARKARKRQRPNELVDRLLAHPRVTVAHANKRFDHSKMYIFDEEILVLGSMGIGDAHHDEWIDMMIELRGVQHVQRLAQRMSGKVDFDPKLRVDFLLHNQHTHEKKTCPMLSDRLELLESAKTSLVIEMAYLGDPRFTRALIDAVNRGVAVTLVTGRDVNVLRSLGRATLSKILKATGAPEHLCIILHPRMVHAKVVVVDGRYSDVGSANFTKLSHGVYDEVNVYIDDQELAAALTEHAFSHRQDGDVVQGPLSYKRWVSQVERATVAYQSRNGA